jgi:peroxiredoxin/mono/diheme cytochrome c family protein
MKFKPIILILVAFLCLAPSRPEAGESARPLRIGERLEDFALKDLDGTLRTLKDYRDSKTLILVFFSLECPVSNKYRGHLVRLHETYHARGVQVIAVNANANESLERIAADVAERPVKFPVLKDPQNVLADRLGAETTPHAFLFDSSRALRYRGEIDDGAGVPEKASSHGLLKALDALLAGREIARPVTRPFGCAIRRASRPPARPFSPGTPTFNRDIVRLLEDHCQGCHRPGGIGQVSFLPYEQAVAWAADIRDAVQRRTMPPWNAREGFGEFVGARRLTEAQIETFSRWVDAGMPEGSPADLPPLREFPEDWTLGKPDLILTPAEAYPVEATGKDEYRCFVMPVDLPEDRYVSAIEVLPGARDVVHHVSVYLDESGRAEALDRADPKPGYDSFGGIGFPPSGTLGGWAPGNTPHRLPDGVGRLLPGNSRVVMQVHYHKSGRAARDLSRLGIYFSSAPVDKRLYEETVASRLLFIPPGAKHYRVTGATTIPRNMRALAILPHMHLLGEEIRVTATRPDSARLPLVWVAPWDFNGQETYVFKTPVPLPRGTRIDLEARYDNSADNPRNPNSPPRWVRWGEESTDEMCIAFLYVTLDDEHLTRNPPLKPENPGLESPQALRQAPDDPDLYFSQHAEKLKAMASHLLDILPSDPDNPAHYYELGTLYDELGRLDEAAEQYRLALERDPGHADAHYKLGLVYQRQDRPEEAAAELEAALQNGARQRGIHYHLGVALARLNRPESAVAQLELALTADPNNAPARLRLGHLYGELKMYDRAVRELQTLLRLHPDHPEAFTVERWIEEWKKR